ncbi:MAG: hypothetical protein JO143_08485 [Acetobacteraceae bacterium]|nr:hypothetical protein [Acetobacteraceae bacterium]
MDPHKTPFGMARRHVAEAERRLARQERLVGDLERGADALSDARALLGLMRDFLGVCREHYHYHVAKQEGRGDEAAFQRMLDLLNAAEVEPRPHEPNSK